MSDVEMFFAEVVSNTLASIAEEMTLIVMRAARSPALREAGDLSSVMTDAEGNLVAQGKDLPIHIGVMSQTVRELLVHIGRDVVRPGDIWILNAPLIGGNHLPDVKLVRPIFSDRKLVAFAISLAHWADIGGTAPGSYYVEASDRWQEGLTIPPIRLARDDVLQKDIMSLILANVRGADERRGDLLAQVAAVRVAETRLQAFVARSGLDRVRYAVDQLRLATERVARQVVDGIPDGTYRGEDRLDPVAGRSRGPRIAVTITVGGDHAEFDFSESDDAILAPVNTTPSVTASAVDFILKMIAGPIMPANGTALAPVEIKVRQGSILQPANGEPVAAGNHETSQRIVDAILNAFSPIIADKVSAGGCGTAGLMILSGRREDGSWWTLYETHGGGEGANAHRDGQSATRVYLSNMMNTPAEFIETEYPVTVQNSRLRRGSGGAGARRGGEGLEREYRIECDAAFMTINCERAQTPPAGMLGGENGQPSRILLIRDGAETVLPSYWNGTVRRGDVVRFSTAGGGGYGLPSRPHDSEQSRQKEINTEF